MQWRLVRKELHVICIEKISRFSLNCRLVPVQYRETEAKAEATGEQKHNGHVLGLGQPRNIPMVDFHCHPIKK